MQDRLKKIQDRLNNVSGTPWIHLFGDETIYEKLEDGCRGLPIARAALGNHYNNAQFIAKAPTDIKFLLAALKEAQIMNHDLELSIAAVRAANDAWKTIVTELREEIKQLKTVWQ